jgi:hypothetical protein
VGREDGWRTNGVHSRVGERGSVRNRVVRVIRALPVAPVTLLFAALTVSMVAACGSEAATQKNPRRIIGLTRSARMTRATRFGRSLSLPPLSLGLQK